MIFFYVFFLYTFFPALRIEHFRPVCDSTTAIAAHMERIKKLKYIDIWGNDIGSLPHEITELKDNLLEIDMRVILMSKTEHQKIKELLPNTKIRFSKSCDCGF